MATFSSLSETTNTSDSDYILVSQSGVDYKQQRETFMASVANTRWSDDTSYTLGSEVIGSDNNKYYALNASFNEDPTTDDGTNWQYIERLPQVENFFKTNQNWNIEGDDGNSVPTTTSTTYADGEEIAAGIYADGEVIMIRSAGGLVSGTGSYYREYEGVDVTDGFYGVKLNSNVISQTGVTVSLEGGNTRVTVNLAAAGAHKFVGLSEKVGVWPDISDSESDIKAKSLTLTSGFNLGQTWSDVSSTLLYNTTYTNDTGKPIMLMLSISHNAPDSVATTIDIDGLTITLCQSTNSGGSVTAVGSIIIPPSSTYYLTGYSVTDYTAWMLS